MSLNQYNSLWSDNLLMAENSKKSYCKERFFTINKNQEAQIIHSLWHTQYHLFVEGNEFYQTDTNHKMFGLIDGWMNLLMDEFSEANVAHPPMEAADR